MTSSRTALPPSRPDTLTALTAGPLDLLVIGGGIVGAGIVRDSAMRGLRVGLVEQHDFAFGTSSRSSRLLHGGLRYLAQGRIGLVREASVEKKIIHEIAPHLAQPLPFIFPTYRNNRHWVLWQLKIGVKLYDLLCGGRNLGRSTWLDRNAVLQTVRGLQSDGLAGAVRYYDGFTNDARLTLDTLRSATRHGALVVNYCRFADAARQGSLWNCQVLDQPGGTPLQLQARTVVNATGPWADGLPHSRVKLRLTKGIHLVVDHTRLPVPDTVVMTEGKRILFAIPWGERTILGTTDTDHEGPPEAVTTTADDLRYVLEVTNRFFPESRLGSEDVRGAWAGLRPLVADPNGAPSDISRSHEIRNPEPGWWDVAGGKLTTYRLMAEQTTDQVVRALKEGGALPATLRGCRTAVEPLLPTPAEARFSGILPPPVEAEAVAHYCAHEWALHLDDVMVRRGGWQHYERDPAGVARQVADWMAPLLGWTPAQREAELARLQEIGAYGNPTAGSHP
ncbi:MAG: glycerol-3-phosphate dehydrogenase/oxidase [Verrucomicrobiae bacterium]|nr:glycerol-3-phosphate dehydrogenase/oxidase [Verrucomicrobiae bacterium]